MSEKANGNLLDVKKRENESSKEFRNRIRHNLFLLIESNKRDIEALRAKVEEHRKPGEVYPKINFNLPDISDRKAFREAMDRLRESLKRPVSIEISHFVRI